MNMQAIGIEVYHYRGWLIEKNPKPIPLRSHDWDCVHRDYDGPDDNRCLTAGSFIDALSAVDDYIEEKL